MSHMPQEGPFIFEDLKWIHRLVSLTSSSVIWYKRYWEVKDIIHICGDFPNVSLMGTWRCINYNLVLSTGKLEYPMESPPEDKLI